MDEFVRFRIARHKQHVQIRNALHNVWYIAMRENGIGGDRESPNYAWPTALLDYLRALVPDNVKGEIFENHFEVSLETLLSCLGHTKQNKM